MLNIHKYMKKNWKQFRYEKKTRNRKDTCFDFGYFQITFLIFQTIHESGFFYTLFRISNCILFIQSFPACLHRVHITHQSHIVILGNAFYSVIYILQANSNLTNIHEVIVHFIKFCSRLTRMKFFFFCCCRNCSHGREHDIGQ